MTALVDCYQYCRLRNKGGAIDVVLFDKVGRTKEVWAGFALDAERAFMEFFNQEGAVWKTRTPARQKAWQEGLKPFLADIARAKVVSHVNGEYCEVLWD